MLNYEEFKNEVNEKILDYLPEEYRDAEVSLVSQKRLNHSVVDAVSIRQGSEEDIYPTLYLNGVFGQYQEHGDLDRALQQMAEAYVNIMKEKEERKNRIDLSREFMEKNIIMQLIGTEANQELLEEIPHREILDFSVILRVLFSAGGNGMESMAVTNEYVKVMGLDVDELFRLAEENTKRITPAVIRSMADVLKMVLPGILSEDAPKEMEEFRDVASGMRILTNDLNINGAVHLIFKENLEKIAEELEDDLYIFPSSIHECIAISACRQLNDNSEGNLAGMVRDINQNHVRQEDRLTDSVYFYDREKGELSIAEVSGTDAEKSKREEETENEKEKNVVA